jgi:hypothetical protein
VADIEQIRVGIAANLRRIPDTQNSAYFLSSPTPPSLCVVGLDEAIYDTSFHHGGDSWTFVIRGVVNGVHDVGAQKALDDWLSSTGDLSVKKAIEVRDGQNGEVTFGGAADDARVVRATRPVRFTYGSGGEFLGAEWFVQVETSNT